MRSVNTTRNNTRNTGCKVRYILIALFLASLVAVGIVFAADRYLITRYIRAGPNWIHLRVVDNPNETIWHIGLKFPGGIAFEREYSGLPGIQPPPLAYWDVKILPKGLALNSLIVAGPLFVFIIIIWCGIPRVFRILKTKSRRARGQCEVCAYVLIAGQTPCPECGHRRKTIKYKKANCGNVQS